MPPRNTLTQSFPNCTFPILSEILDRNLRLLEGVSTTNKAPGSGSNGGASPSRTLLVEAEANTWSRSARRSRHRRHQNDPSTTPKNITTSCFRQPALTCSVQVIDCRSSQATSTEEQSLALEFQWLYGTDRTLFESFVSHVWRKVGVDLQEKKLVKGCAK